MTPDQRPSLTVVTRYFHPDVAGSAIRLTELATGLADRGRDVDVITAQPSYSSLDRGRSKRPTTEEHEGVRIRRVRSTRFDKNHGMRYRVCNQLIFFLAALVALLRSGEDRVLFSTNPPFLPVMGGLLSALRGTEYVLLIHDLHPEFAARLGFLSRLNPAFWIWEWCNAWSYANAETVIVLDEKMAETARSKYGDGIDVTVIHNWEDGDEIVPQSKADNEFAREHALLDDLVVLYSGNIGAMHDLESVVLAMDEFKNEALTALFIGEGEAKAGLQRLVEERGLSNVEFLPYQPMDRLPDSLTCGDVALVTSEKGTSGVCVSGKFYTALASGQAILAIAPRDSTIGRVVKETDCGIRVDPGSPDAVAAALEHWISHPGEVDEMGERARTVFEERFSREHAVDRYDELLRELDAEAA